MGTSTCWTLALPATSNRDRPGIPQPMVQCDMLRQNSMGRRRQHLARISTAWVRCCIKCSQDLIHLLLLFFSLLCKREFRQFLWCYRRLLSKCLTWMRIRDRQDCLGYNRDF